MMNQEEVIKAYFSNLKENELMMVSGESSTGINKTIRQTVIDALNSGKRVALFESDANKNPLITAKEELQNEGLLSVFHSNNFRIDDIEISNNYSLSEIIQEVERKEKTDKKYDLIVITDAEALPELTDFRSPGEIAGKIRKAQKRISAPVIFGLLIKKNVFRGLNHISEKERLFHSVRNFVDFLIRIDDDEKKEKPPLEFDVRFYDCRNREIDASFFFNKDDHKLYLKDENTLSLFKKAIGLGLDKDDAIVYASYWNKNESTGYENDDN